jgi:hypothetical protein
LAAGPVTGAAEAGKAGIKLAAATIAVPASPMPISRRTPPARSRITISFHPSSHSCPPGYGNYSLTIFNSGGY